MKNENLENNVEETKDVVEETAETVSDNPPIKIADPEPAKEEAKEEVKDAEETVKEEVKEESHFGEKVEISTEDKPEETLSKPEGDTANKKNNTPAIIVIILLILITIGVAAYFFLAQSPKKVFHAFFNTVQNDIKSSKYLKTEDKIKGEAEFTATSSIEGFDKIINDKKQTLLYGYDKEKKTLELGLSAENTNNAGLVVFVKDGKTYLKLNQQNKVTILDNSESFGEYAAMLEEFVNEEAISSEEAVYLIDKVLSLIDSSMLDGNFSKSKETVTINKRKVHLNKFTYNIDKKAMVAQTNKVIKGLKDDAKAKEIVNKMFASAKITIEDFEEVKEEDFEGMETLKFSIFTKGFKSVFAGIKAEAKDSSFSYAFDGSEFVINAKDDEFVITANSKKENGKDIVNATAKDKDGNTLAKLTATVNALTDTKLDVDYNLSAAAMKVNGKVSVVGDEKQKKFSASANINKNRITIKGTHKVLSGEVADYPTEVSNMSDLEITGYGIIELQNTYISNYLVAVATQNASIANQNAAAAMPTP